MFTKAQRIELGQLSLKLFGSETYWQRIHKKQRVPGDIHSQETKRYMRLKNGQIVSIETAVARGLVPAQVEVKGVDGAESTWQPQALTQPSSRISYRAATFDELKNAFLSALETKTFSEMPPVQAILSTAVKFLKKDLINMPFLVVGENSQRDFEDLLRLVPEDRREEILKYKVPNSNPRSFCVDGVQFLSDIVFASSQPDKAAEMLEQYSNGPTEEAMAAGQPVGESPDSVAGAS